jgi:hypothetical protein
VLMVPLFWYNVRVLPREFLPLLHFSSFPLLSTEVWENFLCTVGGCLLWLLSSSSLLSVGSLYSMYTMAAVFLFRPVASSVLLPAKVL